VEGAAGIDELRELVARLGGCSVKAVQVPPDSEGRIGLRLSVQERHRWLWIHSVAWRLDGREAVLAASGDDGERLAVDLTMLVGRVITSVDGYLVGTPGSVSRTRY
jgi:hypothetical protein